MRHILGVMLVCLVGSVLVWGQPPAGDDEADQYFDLSGDFSASHILVAYRGADRARKDVKRTKKEAKVKAKELAARLNKEPELFETLAVSESDGTTSKDKGYLGTFRRDAMDSAFIAGLRDLEFNQISSEPVKTRFGYHIIRREPMSIKYFTLNALVLTYRNAVRIRALKPRAEGFKREKDEARALAKSLSAELNADNFEAKAAEINDLRDAWMGPFKKGDNEFYDTMIGAIKDLPYNGLSEVVELSFGFAILQRQKVIKLAGSQIWISYIGAESPPYEVIRTKEEAAALAQKLAVELRENPKKFAQLAKENSDGPFSSRGGRLTEWFAGTRDRQIDRAMLKLEVGEVTQEPIETEKGFFLVTRGLLRSAKP